MTRVFIGPTGSGSAGVGSFNGRTGIVVPTSGDYAVADVTGAAPLASPTLTGTPSAPTAAPGTNSTRISTTAYADAAVAVELARAQAAENSLQAQINALGTIPPGTGIAVGLNDVEGWGSTQAATIRNAGIRWGRGNLETPGAVTTALSYGFKLVTVCANSADGTLITTLNNTTQANLAVSQIQSEPGSKIYEFMNEPWLKGNQAHAVKYARMYMAALSALRAAGIHEPLLYCMTGSWNCQATTQSCTLTSGSPTVTMASTDEIIQSQTITGTGIPAGSFVASLNSNGTQFTIGNAGSPNATVSGAQNVTFAARFSNPDDVTGHQGWIQRPVLTVAGLAAAILANGVSLHPYGMPTEDTSGHAAGIATVAFHATNLATATALGATPKMWITEFGYRVDGVTSGATTGVLVVDQAEQALRAGQAHSAMEAVSAVQGILEYQSHDDSPSLAWGVMNNDGTTRAAFTQVAAAANRHGDPLIPVL